jgi:FkbH-like protein
VMSDLAWLRDPPPDFRARLNALKKKGADAEASLELLRLASYRLDESQLAKLASVGQALSGGIPQLTLVKVALVGDGTQSLVASAIEGSGIRHGVLIDVILGGYSAVVQESFDETSAVHAAKPDLVVLATDCRILGLSRAAASREAANDLVESAFARTRMIVERMRKSARGGVIVQTVPGPTESLFGSFDRVEGTSPFAMSEAFNEKLREWARNGGIVIADVARLAASIGYERWDDPRHWHASKLPFSPDFIPIYADVIARVVGALMGKAKKVLVLDLDNTLWGGVIGDDGLDGIVLGQGSATGEAFVAVQNFAVDLRQRGVVLAVCSKNEDTTARQPFKEHPEMALKEGDIAAFQANWTDKASNLRTIAEKLNLGIDSLVFVDDNPAEREQVRRELPTVGVPELPDDPAYYPRYLAAAGYFEAVAFSEEDRARAGQYQTNAARADLLSSSSDMDSYLRSLDMHCHIGPVSSVNRARVAQLINKANQYNLTTRRYTEAQVADIETRPDKLMLQVRLEDRFGDNGIISIVIVSKTGIEWDIDTWLMSCRVLGRRVEKAVLNTIAGYARSQGAEALTGSYIPSAKNQMVKDHYRKLSFKLTDKSDSGATQWRLSLAEYNEPELPMRIEVYLVEMEGV